MILWSDLLIWVAHNEIWEGQNDKNKKRRTLLVRFFFSKFFLECDGFDMNTLSFFNIAVRTIELTLISTADNFFNFSIFSSTTYAKENGSRYKNSKNSKSF